ncbi:NAD(P)/FAD-dependent oxidoreductase [Mycoplasmatota bacterium]|nr:NAD(P)/FAD-dependent oxidoreductase [Mycoplasmatota bacterium]
MFDVIIIGAGPSGMMCAIRASQNGKKVLLLERNTEIGKKMRLTGGGRCNITNLKDVKQFINSLPVKNGRFLYSALNQFDSQDIYHYFEQLGVPLKIEKDDKVFPQSNQSLDFILALKKQLDLYHVIVKCDTEVTNIEFLPDYKRVQTTKDEYIAPNVVIATGGKSYPHTGSTGFGYDIAKKLNHTLIDLFPTESPLISHDPLIHSKELQGLSFSDVTLSLVDEEQRVIKSHTSDLIITHFGLSGPAALKLSQFVYHYLKDHRKASIQIDFLPEFSLEDLIQLIKKKRNNEPQKNLKTIIKDLLPNRLLDYLFKTQGISEQLKMADISNKLINQITNFIKKFTIKVHEVKPLQAAFVTGGGISLKEINPKTMESKLIPGLYFIGEVLDLHGYTGGYNMTIALTTGHSAGMSIK